MYPPFSAPVAFRVSLLPVFPISESVSIYGEIDGL